MSRASLIQVSSIFLVVIQPLPGTERATIPHLNQDIQKTRIPQLNLVK